MNPASLSLLPLAPLPALHSGLLHVGPEFVVTLLVAVVLVLATIIVRDVHRLATRRAPASVLAPRSHFPRRERKNFLTGTAVLR